jgi:PAS domain S-box-containing protein
MFGILSSMFEGPALAGGLRLECRALLLERLRIGAILGLVFIPAFVPVDYVRMPDHFAWAVIVRLTGCAVLAALLPLVTTAFAQRRAEWLAALGVTAISATILGVARFAQGAADPLYLVQAMALVVLIMGTALLLPLDGRTMLMLGAIPFVMQALATLNYPFLENLPILCSSFTALMVASVGAQTAFVNRLGDYEGRQAKEALLDARSEIVAMLERDVAARKRTEESLRKSEQRYRALFEETHDGVILSSTDGGIFDANPAALAMFGYQQKDELCTLLTHQLQYDGSDGDHLRISRLLRADDTTQRDLEVEFRRKDGSKLVAMVSSSPIRAEDGKLAGFRMILRDVTERRMFEARLRQTQKLEAVGILAAGVAHEINNPLTYVLSHLQTMLQDFGRLEGAAPLSPAIESMRNHVREAADGADRVRNIVRDLKTFARRGEEERGAVDLIGVLETSIKLSAHELRNRAHVRRDLRPVPQAVGDQGRLSQVFVNLLINAAQAIEEGAAERNEIAIATRATEEEVLVEISDTGAGIAPENLDRLFDPFFTTKSSSGGSGLGLSICYNIVSSFGGRIEVESKPGMGSRFTVRLPIARVQRVEHPALPAIRAASRRGRILVVDDEPFVLSTVTMILGRDHELVGVSSGAEALAAIEKDDHFDVILCDLMMQKSSGMDVYGQLLRRHPRLVRRVVFMTGGAYTPAARSFLARISNRCVDKPFGAADLTKVVEQVMAGDAERSGTAPRRAARSAA